MTFLTFDFYFKSVISYFTLLAKRNVKQPCIAYWAAYLIAMVCFRF